ncbi:MAG: sigma 54-interacting transcriptional regulator [Gemmatimonadaceae bacterium]|nr:sigma 54-interacting transcriptional regulator [Gemmatimonadaceae bacterium]
MLAAQHRMLLCAQADGPVLITGETGTGKELFARAMFLLSKRRKGTLSVRELRAVPGRRQLIASELFGHRRGSFTGAVADHRGIFEEADGGVVFLDEIAELSPVAQAMLLRAISEGEIVPVGENRPRAVNVRIFAATGRDLKAMVARGQFRDDLYFRLRHLHVGVPALRDRGDDWALIAELYLRALAASSGESKFFSSDARHQLGGYRWPGNVRELRSIVETAFHMSSGPVIARESLCFYDDLDCDRFTPPETAIVALAPRAVESMPSGPKGDAVAHGKLDALYRAVVEHRESFWAVVYEPFMARDLRADARGIIERGLTEVRGTTSSCWSGSGWAVRSTCASWTSCATTA